MAGSTAEIAVERVSMTAGAEMKARMDWLIEVCALDNYAELFSAALSVLDWVVEQSANGNEIASIDETKLEVTGLAADFLDSAAEYGRKRKAAS